MYIIPKVLSHSTRIKLLKKPSKNKTIKHKAWGNFCCNCNHSDRIHKQPYNLLKLREIAVLLFARGTLEMPLCGLFRLEPGTLLSPSSNSFFKRETFCKCKLSWIRNQTLDLYSCMLLLLNFLFPDALASHPDSCSASRNMSHKEHQILQRSICYLN